MTGYENAVDERLVTLVSMTLMIFLALPGASFSLWKALNGKWTTLRSRRVSRRNRETGEKLKKYCEIDMRKFR
jgi:hypothetical protein